MFKPSKYCIDLMNRLQARRELRQFKYLLNTRAAGQAVQATLSGSLPPSRLTTRAAAR